MDKKLLVVIRRDTNRNDEAYHLDWWDKEGLHSSAYEDRLTLKELKADYRKGGYKVKLVTN
jgi:type IV secretory pathway VirD2 relaxase